MPVTLPKEGEYWTSNEVAAELGVQVRSVAHYVARGLLEGHKVGRTLLIHRDEVERYKRERRSVGRPRAAAVVEKLDDLLTTQQAAKLIGVRPTTVATYVRRKMLAGTKVGHSVLVSKAEVQRYLSERRPVGRPYA